jgi:hypothetical protein
MTPILAHLSRAARVFGAAAVMLALVGQLVSGSFAVDTRALDAAMALMNATIQCQSDGGTAHDSGKPLKTAPDQGLLALASIVSLPSPILTPVLAIPAPRPRPVACSVRVPPARAPPGYFPIAALPRGPPGLT